MLASAPLQSAEAAKETPKTITVDELNSLRVIGKLGIPLGKVVEMQATVVVGGGKDSSRYYLKVTAVAGKPLKEPVVMRFRSLSEDIPASSFDLYKGRNGKIAESLTEEVLKPLEKDYVGSEVTFSAYEGGAFTGIPEGLPDPGTWQGFSFQFVPEITVISKSDP